MGVHSLLRTTLSSFLSEIIPYTCSTCSFSPSSHQKLRGPLTTVPLATCGWYDELKYLHKRTKISLPLSLHFNILHRSPDGPDLSWHRECKPHGQPQAAGLSALIWSHSSHAAAAVVIRGQWRRQYAMPSVSKGRERIAALMERL